MNGIKISSMAKEDKRYFNFPIVLLNGFLINHKKVLNNIFDYCIVAYCTKYSEDIAKAAKYFGVKVGNETVTYNNGMALFDTIDEKCPKAGLSNNMFFDYYSNEKTEFDKVVLLAFLAIKSIVQDQAFTKLDYKYLFSRMAGLPKSVIIIEQIPCERLLKYYNEYQCKKIKSNLVQSWGLVHYARYSRGFYVSFKLSLEDLIFQAERKRKSRIDKEQKALEKAAYESAMKRLQ
jgi:hypothetical protein